MSIYCFLEFSAGLAVIPGKVIIELFNRQVPKTAENFRALSTGDNDKGLSYQDTSIHRVIESFTIQGGATGQHGSKECGIYDDEKELDTDLYWRDIDEAYLVCMADSIPKSQFFITLQAAPHLNGKYCCIGRVIRGQDVLTSISKVEVDEDDRPVESVRISRCGELEYHGPSVHDTADRDHAVGHDQHNDRRVSSSKNASRADYQDESRPHVRTSTSRSNVRKTQEAKQKYRPRQRSASPRRDSEKYWRQSIDRYKSKAPIHINTSCDDHLTTTAQLRTEDVEYKGRGKMSYNSRARESGSGRLT